VPVKPWINSTPLGPPGKKKGSALDMIKGEDKAIGSTSRRSN
jgi:hypothetical protein